MRPVVWLARGALVLALLAAGFLALEYGKGRRGPVPGPDTASMTAGRELVTTMLARTGLGWASTDTIEFTVTPRKFGRTSGPLRIRFAASSRAMSLVSATGHDSVRYDPGSGRFDGEVSPGLRALLPSISFWTVAPGAFDDPTAILWRLPDAGGRARVAARWPGEVDWFILEMAPDGGRFHGLEFIDARFWVFLRWDGRYEGPLDDGAPPIPARWSFRPAAPVLDFLGGRRELVSLEYRR
jgi:hypothetical protein